MICHSCLHSHVMLRNISTIIIKVKASGKMYVVTTKTIYKKRVSLRRVMYNCINAFFFLLQLRWDQAPVTYYTSLLVFNLFQFPFVMAVKISDTSFSIPLVIYLAGLMVTLYSKMCIALERYRSVFQCVYLHVYEHYIIL